MIFSKEEQRRKAAEFEAAQKAKGVSAPPPQPIVLTKSAPVTQHQTPIGQYSVKPSVNFSKSVVSLVKPKKVAKKSYVEEPMTNHLGQVVNPGDKVVLITQGYSHSTHATLGTYLGAAYRNKWAPTKASSYAVLVERKVYNYKTKTSTLKTVRTTSYAGMIYPTR